MSLSKHNLLSALALCAGAISATACADSTGPITSTPYEGTATVWTGGPDASASGVQFGLQASKTGATDSLKLLRAGDIVGAAPASALTLSEHAARGLGRRTHLLRTRNAAARDGFDYVEIRPKTIGSPSSRITLTHDGKAVTIVDVEYVPRNGNWQLASVATTKYDGEGRVLERGRLDASQASRLFSLNGLTNVLVGALLPKSAQAMSGPVAPSGSIEFLDEEEAACDTEFRRVLLSLASMTVAGIMNNPLAFAIATLGLVNNLNAWGRCLNGERDE